jgi:hypothetical protein
MPDSVPDMADSIPLIRHIVRHRPGPMSVMPPEWCPPSLRNRVRHGPAYAFFASELLSEDSRDAGAPSFLEFLAKHIDSMRNMFTWLLEYRRQTVARHL